MKNIYKATFVLLIPILLFACKKDQTNAINTLFTNGTWEVTSILAYNYVGDTQNATDTLNTDCTEKQLFKFTPDGTCTYTNFACVTQTSTGTWSLSRDRLYLISDITCKDTTETGTVKPFENTKIINLGQYSMVVQTGDIQSNYRPNQSRRIVQYSFIRQKNTPNSN